MYEVGGGAGLEFFAAQGAHTSFNGDFRLVGDVDGGGLAMTGFGDAVHTNIASQMQGVNTTVWTRYAFAVSDPAEYESSHLNVKYNDGFVAYLNGVEICRRNAAGNARLEFQQPPRSSPRRIPGPKRRSASSPTCICSNRARTYWPSRG